MRCVIITYSGSTLSEVLAIVTQFDLEPHKIIAFDPEPLYMSF